MIVIAITTGIDPTKWRNRQRNGSGNPAEAADLSLSYSSAGNLKFRRSGGIILLASGDAADPETVGWCAMDRKADSPLEL